MRIGQWTIAQRPPSFGRLDDGLERQRHRPARPVGSPNLGRSGSEQNCTDGSAAPCNEAAHEDRACQLWTVLAALEEPTEPDLVGQFRGRWLGFKNDTSRDQIDLWHGLR